MKVAIVHDWLTNMGGAERVVYQLHKLFPDAPIYTSVYDKSAVPLFDDAHIETTFLQKFPFKTRHQLYAALRPRAFRRLDLSEYDVVISSSSAESKQVKVREDAIHVCYCHTPIRYYWSHYGEYIAKPGLGFLNPLARYILPLLVPGLKRADYKAAQRVTKFIANSKEVEGRITKYYDRESVVINPPVDVKRFAPSSSKQKRSGYVIAGRLVAYKRYDLAVEACTQLGIDLTVIGNGPELENLKKIAGENVKFVTKVRDSEMPQYFHRAKGFIFAGLEDFGIIPIEAMAAGLPVIAYKAGGLKETVIDGETGTFFNTQSVSSLKQAVKKFESTRFNETKVIEHAQQYSNDRFKLEIKEFIDSLV